MQHRYMEMTSWHHQKCRLQTKTDI